MIAAQLLLVMPEGVGTRGLRTVATSYPYTVQPDNAPKVRFSATLGHKEPEVEVALV